MTVRGVEAEKPFVSGSKNKKKPNSALSRRNLYEKRRCSPNRKENGG
jgi:hypothetical protein